MTEIIINTELGQIKGVQRSNALTNAALYSFQGIPYAAPPVGDLRFRPPQAHPGWEGTLDATKEGGICVQNDVMLGMFESGSDDCLYLNVYSPCITAGANKAVMVFVHGGGFTFGHPAEVFYGPDWLVAKDVVLVAIHYRVNIFGFLNLGLEDCPGNVGLRDIMASLQWVQANISDFGGNPNNVTLFGESAGAASIHYLLMVPSTRGLFHRVIMQSGSALDSWAFHTAEDNRDNGVAVAKLLGCQSEDSRSVLDFLKSQPALDLLKPQEQIVAAAAKSGKSLVFPFVPSVECTGLPENRLVWDTPAVMLKQKLPSIPFLCGLNSQEGIIMLKQSPGALTKVFDSLDRNFERTVPNNFHADRAKAKLIAAEIRQFYFEDRPIDMGAINRYLDLYSDLLFALGHYETLFSYSQSNPGQGYAYLFSYEGDLNVFKNAVQMMYDLQIPGASHVDELGYLFCVTMMGGVLKPGSTEEKVSENIRTLWTNFAKNGVPNTETFTSWTPCSHNDISYLDIGSTLSTEQGFVFSNRFAFWKNLYASYQANFLKGNL
uniref:Carboxylic ester hydrolase n=1 Tax=Diaphorina citri TaxID=121845 RepID=A0A482LN42_DIACI|nr:esterase EST-5 [Diaphorina citri]